MNKKLGTVIALTGIATFTIHIINRVQFSVSTVKNILNCPNNKYYEWRFGKIRYTKKGTGSPVLLLHNLTAGSSGYEFSAIIDSLAEKHEVYTIDFLGYGLSDKPNITYTNYLYVQSIIDFIKNIIGKKTSIIATGDAAPVAIMACHNDGEVIDKMIFINPQSINKLNQVPSKQTKLLKLLIDTPIIGTFLYNMLTRKESFRKEFEEEYYYNTSAVSDEILSNYVEASHVPDFNAKFSFASYICRYMNANIIHALKQIDHSMYILYGESKDDINTIVDNYIYFNQSIEAFGIPKTKQLCHLESPDSVMEQINILL